MSVVPETRTPAAAPVQRKPVHLRTIQCQGFERDDGLVDIEGTLTDTKPHDLQLRTKPVSAGQPIHRMTLCLTIDRERLIHAVQVQTLAAPYGVCSEIGPRYQQLVGLRIEPGFNLAVKRLFKGVLGCTHMTELLPVMATTAYQILWSRADEDPQAKAQGGQTQSSALNGCHALSLEGEVVKRYFPQWAKTS